MTAKTKKEKLQKRVNLFMRLCQIEHELNDRSGQIEISAFSVNGARPAVLLMAERALIEDKLKSL